MQTLIAINGVDRLLRAARPFTGGNGLVTSAGSFAESILKFKSISVCEVFGYSLATLIDIRVARAQRF